LVFGLWSLVFGLWFFVFGLWSLVFAVKSFKSPKIPLCQRGTLKPPFGKGGQGGFFILGGEAMVNHERLV
jgi:hypothetical protein